MSYKKTNFLNQRLIWSSNRALVPVIPLFSSRFFFSSWPKIPFAPFRGQVPRCSLRPSMKPGLSSPKFVRLVQPSIRVSTKAISPFNRGLIQLIRQRPFSVASSRPRAQTELLSYQSIRNSNFPVGHLNPNFLILQSSVELSVKKQKPSRNFATYFITPRLLITKHRPAPYQ